MQHNSDSNDIRLNLLAEEEKEEEEDALEVDRQLTRMREELHAIKTKRVVDRATHESLCGEKHKRMAAAQHRMECYLKCHQHFRSLQHQYKHVMTQIQGGLDSAPPRYILDVQTKLLFYLHQAEVHDKELQRHNSYKNTMTRYMSCEKRVLEREYEETQVKLCATLSSAANHHHNHNNRNNNRMKMGVLPRDESRPVRGASLLLSPLDKFRPGMLERTLSPSSFWKRSFTKSKELQEGLLANLTSSFLTTPVLPSPGSSSE